MNPFDPKTVLLAKHAQHVVLVHFPIALFLTAVGFDVAAEWTKKPVFATVARYNMMIAAIATLPDRKSTRLNSSHEIPSRMPSSA